jgi:putative ABC transport system permease protein
VWGTDILLQFSPAIPRIVQVNPDARVLAFTFALSVLTGALFGLAPALSTSKTDLVGSLKKGGHAFQGSPHNRLRGVLVAAETAVAVVLLVGAGLLIGSFRQMTDVDPGFNFDHVLTFKLALPNVQYSEEQKRKFFDRLVDRVRNEPGVRSAAAMFPIPLGDSRISVSFEIEGRPISKADLPTAAFRQVSPGYFEAMGIPVIAGRDFTERDDATSPGAVIVNQEFERRFFPNENPIGKRIRPLVSRTGEPITRNIIGVVGDVKHRSLRDELSPEFYMAYSQLFVANMSVVVRTQGDPRNMITVMRGIVFSMDKDLPLYNVKTMDEILSGSVAQPRFNALLLGIFASVALVLTGVGLYGIVAYSVECRTREIGLRMALGAGRPDILRMMVGNGLALTLTGLAIGLSAAFFITRLMSSLLFRVTPTDPVTLTTAALILLGVAVLASFIPARRATEVDSMVALRHE